ncbi:MAG: response regulator transcription factor [Actinomycetota bacterium]
MRVLVIDDEQDVLLLCRVNFEFAGHEVLEAADGDRGMELATALRPDLIVLDIMLPRRDGIALLSELARRPETKGTPVVLLTARVQEDDRLRGWRAGADEYVTKPFSPTALTEIVERVHRMSPEDRLRRRNEALSGLLASA